MQQSTIHLPPTYFYPRPPRGGRRVPCDSVCQTIEDFYPRPPRGGRRAFLRCTGGLRHISIHALREEGDELFYDAQEAYGIFLSTPSARRATVAGNTVGVFILLFLSTPSARRATRAIVRDHECRGFLSTPSARRATWRSRGPRKTPSNFYPRPPRGGRPGLRCLYGRDHRISIHALREEGDLCCMWAATGTTAHFYPRPPRGGRPASTSRAARS